MRPSLHRFKYPGTPGLGQRTLDHIFRHVSVGRFSAGSILVWLAVLMLSYGAGRLTDLGSYGGTSRLLQPPTSRVAAQPAAAGSPQAPTAILPPGRMVPTRPPGEPAVTTAVAAAQPPAVAPAPAPAPNTPPPAVAAVANYGTYYNTYVRGQCTWYVASRRRVPSNWGHARTWYSRAQRAGWAVGTAPRVGAIAWTSAGWYGHVALVEAVGNGTVSVVEMNYSGPYRITRRTVPASTFKYIY